MWSGQYPGPSASVDLKLQNLQWWVLRPTAGEMASRLLEFALHVSEIANEADLPSSFVRSFLICLLLWPEYARREFLRYL